MTWVRIDKIYFDAVGGKGFYASIILILAIQTCVPIISKGFLSFWADAYEKLPLEKVPVRW